MNNQPTKITIIREFGRGGFTVIAQQSFAGELEIADALTFDEMLGTIARAMCPTMDDDTPNRKIGPPLFLTAPTKD